MQWSPYNSLMVGDDLIGLLCAHFGRLRMVIIHREICVVEQNGSGLRWRREVLVYSISLL